MDKDPEAFRTISEAAAELDLPQHVLRFWETRFTAIKPMKRGGRRYYRPSDVRLLAGIKYLLYDQGYTIKGVQRILREQGASYVIASPPEELEGQDSELSGAGESTQQLNNSLQQEQVTSSTNGPASGHRGDIDEQPPLEEIITPADSSIASPGAPSPEIGALDNQNKIQDTQLEETKIEKEPELLTPLQSEMQFRPLPSSDEDTVMSEDTLIDKRIEDEDENKKSLSDLFIDEEVRHIAEGSQMPPMGNSQKTDDVTMGSHGRSDNVTPSQEDTSPEIAYQEIVTQKTASQENTSLANPDSAEPPMMLSEETRQELVEIYKELKACKHLIETLDLSK